MFEDFKEKIRRRMDAEHEKWLFAEVLGDGKQLSVMEKERIRIGKENRD